MEFSTVTIACILEYPAKILSAKILSSTFQLNFFPRNKNGLKFKTREIRLATPSNIIVASRAY